MVKRKPIDEAEAAALRERMDGGGWTVEDLARHFGRTPAQVRKALEDSEEPEAAEE